jgi:hypothetical protein
MLQCRSLTPAYYSLRRGATGALRELVTGSRIAQRRLLAPEHAAAYATLMGRVLQECGDHQTQVRAVCGCMVLWAAAGGICVPCCFTPAAACFYHNSCVESGVFVPGQVLQLLWVPWHACCEYLHLMSPLLLLLQVDLFEVLYRCGRGMGEKAYRQHLDAQVGPRRLPHAHAVLHAVNFGCTCAISSSRCAQFVLC